MSIQIILGVLILVTFICAYFAAKRWHVGHVSTVVCIVLFGSLYAVLALKNLQIKKKYQTKYQVAQKRLTTMQEELEALQRGTTDESIINRISAYEKIKLGEDENKMPGVTQISHEYKMMVQSRGLAWGLALAKIVPTSGLSQEGAVQVAVSGDQHHGIKTGYTIFLFEKGFPNVQNPSEGSRYLGEFKVISVDDKAVGLQTIATLDRFSANRIMQSIQRVTGASKDKASSWVMYDEMPADRPDLFEGMSQELLQKYIPSSALANYLHHGEPARADDDPYYVAKYDQDGVRVFGNKPDQKVVKKIYMRPSLDYAYIFQQLNQDVTFLQAEIDSVASDNGLLAVTRKNSESLQIHRSEERDKLTEELENIDRERRMIETHLKKLKRQLADAKENVARQVAKNKSLAVKYTAHQIGLLNQANEKPARGALDLGQVEN